MNKKMVIIMVSISLLMILSGVLLVFLDYKSSVEKNKVISTTNKKDEEESKRGTPPPLVKNQNKKIKEKHCLNDLCIEKMLVSKLDDDAYVVAAEMTNNSSKEMKEIFLNLEFEVDGEIIKLWCYVDKIESKATFDFETGGEDKRILKATDYKITAPTEDELSYYKTTFVD